MATTSLIRLWPSIVLFLAVLGLGLGLFLSITIFIFALASASLVSSLTALELQLAVH